MKHGDISNQRGYVFGFRVENSLLTYRDSVIDAPLNLIMGRTSRAVVNSLVRKAMEYLYWDTEHTVLLVIDDKNYTREARDFLKDYPFNQVMNVRGIVEVTTALLSGEMSYYVDECEATRSMAQNEHALTLQQFWNIVPRLYRRRV